MLWIRRGAVRYSHWSWASPYSVPRTALGASPRGAAGGTMTPMTQPPLDQTSSRPARRPAPTAATPRRSTTCVPPSPRLPPLPARWSSCTAASGAQRTTASTRARGPGLRRRRATRSRGGVPPSRYAGWRRPRDPRRRARGGRRGLAHADLPEAARPRRPLGGRPPRRPGRPGSRGPTSDGIAGVVSLAGVVDLGAADRLHLGDDAARDFVGAGTGTDAWTVRRPDATAAAEGAGAPRQRGEQDDIVPARSADAYLPQARAAGGDVTSEVVEGADHFAVIDPTRRPSATSSPPSAPSPRPADAGGGLRRPRMRAAPSADSTWPRQCTSAPAQSAGACRAGAGEDRGRPDRVRVELA